jgi:outer membrane receptor protein involved in Fe transport
MSGHRPARIGLGMLLLAIGLSSVATAQIRTADVLGVVSDTSAAAVPGASVTIKNLATNVERTVSTDGTGNFLFTLLPPGRYTVRAELPGFKAWTVPEVTLAAGDRLTLDAKLEVGGAQETVNVTAEAPVLQRQSSTLGALVDERAVQDLPLNGRNFITLAQLAPGAADSTIGFATGGNSPDDRRLSSQVAVNGQYAWANNFMIDGMDNNERFIGTVIVKPSVEAIQEMKVQTNLYTAELGRTAGGAINLITKSGTNEFRGSAYEFYRNERLDARNFFAAQKAPYRHNQFGGSLGGPLQRSRTFFFGDFEELRVEQGQTFISTVPTLAMRDGNFAGVARIFDPLTTNCVGTVCTRAEFAGGQIPANRLDAIALRVINLYPGPTNNQLANNYTTNASQTLDQDTFDIRIDHRLSEANSVFGRYSFADIRSFFPPAIAIGDGSFAGPSDQNTHGAQVNYIRTLSSRSVVELRGGWSRFYIGSVPVNYGTNLSEEVGIRNSNVNLRSSGLAPFLPSGYRTIGDGSFVPEFNTNDVYQIGGSVTNQRGPHSIKIGTEYRRRHVNQTQSPFPRGRFQFNPTLTVDNPLNPSAGTGHSIASMLLGYPSLVDRQLQIVDPEYRYWELGVFVQDDVRVTPWLTANLGLRYDYYSPLTETQNHISNVDLSTGRIIVAGQDGVSRTAGVNEDWVNLAPRLGFAATVNDRTVVRGGYGVSFVPPFMGSPGAMRNPPLISLFSSVPAAITPTANIADALPEVVPADPSNPVGSLNAFGFDFQIPYVHQFNVTLQRELPLRLVGSVSYVGQRGEKQFLPNSSPDLNAPTPGNPGTVQQRRPFAAQLPRATNIFVYGPWAETRYNALQLSVERRFRSGFGAVANYTLAHAEDNFEFRPTAEGGVFLWADSNLDIRHRFTVAANYQLPFAENAAGVVAALAKGWQLNLIGQAQTSTPFSITNNADIAGTGGPGTTPDRPNLVGDPNLPSSERSVRRWFNTAAFARQPVGTFGDIPRNSMRGPNMVKFDLSAAKTLEFPRGMNVQFTAQAFNVFNHTSLGLPNGQLGSPAFGTISTAGPPRQMQLAAKLMF